MQQVQKNMPVVTPQISASCMFLDAHLYMHTCANHICIHKYIYTYIHTYIHAYIHRLAYKFIDVYVSIVCIYLYGSKNQCRKQQDRIHVYVTVSVTTKSHPYDSDWTTFMQFLHDGALRFLPENCYMFICVCMYACMCVCVYVCVYGCMCLCNVYVCIMYAFM